MDATTATSPPSPGRAEPGLERLLRRPDLVVAAGVLGLAAVAWWDLLRRGDVLCAAIAAPWQWGDLGMAIAMWSIMMVAMMVPSAAPMAMTFARVQRHRRATGQVATPLALFVAGYVLVWTAWSVGAATLQWAMQSLLLLSHHLTLESSWLAGAVLIAAGIYQWTPLKARCLVHCRSPLGFFLARWREGWAGALGMGARHGLYCVGCCSALMALLFVVGVMNMVWVAGLTAYVLAEKLLPWAAASRGVGAVLVVWGVAVLAS